MPPTFPTTPPNPPDPHSPSDPDAGDGRRRARDRSAKPDPAPSHPDPPPAPSSPPAPPPPSEGLELAPGLRVWPNALSISASRSAGPGGQNVNKRSTKIELRLRVADLPLKAWQRDRLRRLAGARLTSDDELILTAETERTQGGNRRAAMERLRALLVEAMHRPAPRRPTKPTRGSIERRIKAKKEQGEKKRRRRDPLQ
ncbi:MAG: alternative ribosome rescue aminoacyl-tRNA hydrolase ArfB [Phycisphaerales bacterium]